MEIKRNNTKDELITIAEVPIGSIFKLPNGRADKIYLRTQCGHICLGDTYTVVPLGNCRTDSCAQVLKATLTVEG